MRLPAQQLPQHLQQALQPLYVFAGDEPLAQRESLDALRNAARRQGYDERLSLVVERNFNWQQVAAFGQSASRATPYGCRRPAGDRACHHYQYRRLAA